MASARICNPRNAYNPHQTTFHFPGDLGNDSVFSRTLQSPHTVAEEQLIYSFFVEVFHFAFMPQQTVLDLRSPGWGVFYDERIVEPGGFRNDFGILRNFFSRSVREHDFAPDRAAA